MKYNSKRLIKNLFLIIIWGCFFSSLSVSQYLTKDGTRGCPVLGNSSEMTNILNERMNELAKYGIRSEELRYNLAYQNITPEALNNLNVKLGIDLTKNDDNVSSYDEFAVIADCITYGKVIDIQYQNSCYRTRYVIKVLDECLKPIQKSDAESTIIVLGAGGILNDGSRILYSGERTFEKDKNYIFFLSNSILRRFTSSQSSCSNDYNPKYYIAYEISPPVENGNVNLDLVNKNISFDSFKTRLKEIVDALNR